MCVNGIISCILIACTEIGKQLTLLDHHYHFRAMFQDVGY